MIRVLQIVSGMDCGGIENFIMNIYRNIDKTKVQFDFLYHTGQPCFFDNEIQDLGGKIYRFPMSEGVNIFKYITFLKSFFKDNKYTIIHGHYSMFGVFYNYYAKKAGVKVRIGHAHTKSAVGSGLNKIADIVLTPLFTYGLTARFACVDDAGKYMFKNKEYEVYTNGIDMQKFLFNSEDRTFIRNQYNIPAEALIIGSIGQFRPEKNQTWLISLLCEILKKEENVYLILVGDGEQRKNIEAEATKYNLKDNVILAGLQKNPSKFYSAMDIFVMPSIFEGLSLSAVEAQANGLPCVVSDGVPKEVDVTGSVTFISLKNKNEWANEILKLYKNHKGRNIDIDKFKQSEYDCSFTAEKLQNFYISNDSIGDI